MPVRRFDGVDDVVKCALGTRNGFSGPWSVAYHFRRLSAAGNDFISVYHDSEDSFNHGVYFSGATPIVIGAGGSGESSPPTLTVDDEDGWVTLLITKPAGESFPIFRVFYHGSETEDKETGGGVGFPNLGGAASLWIGGASVGDHANMDIAAEAWWNKALSDEDFAALVGAEGLKTGWEALEPAALLTFDQASVEEAVVDLTGNEANQTSRTGTTVIEEEPPIPYEAAGETLEASASGEGTGTGEATALVEAQASASGEGTGTGEATATLEAFASASGEGVGTGSASAEVESQEPAVLIPRKPATELDVEIETAEGAVIRLAADDPRADYRPMDITFATARGDGFAQAGFTLHRQIFRDYPEISLLNTVRFNGRNGEIAYEGRIHSYPRTNQPTHLIQVAVVGWSSYLKSKEIARLFIDRRLSSWGDPFSARRAYVMSELNRRYEASVEHSPADETHGPSIILTYNNFNASHVEHGEQWLHAGGEIIEKFRAGVRRLIGAADSDFSTFLRLTDNRNGEGTIASEDYDKGNTADGFVESNAEGLQWAFVEVLYQGASTNESRNVVAIEYPRVIGDHGLEEHGTKPGEGYWASDIIRSILERDYPKLSTAGIEENTTLVEQATWHDRPADGAAAISEINDLTLWETGVEEGPTYYYRPADFTRHDWQLRTDDPGVVVNFQGDSIESFYNGVIVTYEDFFGHTFRLLPSDHDELRDDSEDNPANRHGEDLWLPVRMPWKGLQGEGLQFGRAYLAESNRPKRPGSFTVEGHIRDTAGNWVQAWNVRNSQTIIVGDHPEEEQPRLITGTSWSQDGLQLTIYVDAPPQLIEAIIARTSRALEAANL